MASSPNHEPGRMLVVDDSAVVRRLVAAHLRRAGHRVVEASDAPAALASFRSAPCEVVITDVNMPGLGGLELLAELRRVASPPEVILLTGARGEDPRAAIQALRLGAHDYISKAPSALEAVELAARSALEKWRLRQQNEGLSLFARADAALERARRQGRNQTRADREEEPTAPPSGGGASIVEVGAVEGRVQ